MFADLERVTVTGEAARGVLSRVSDDYRRYKRQSADTISTAFRPVHLPGASAGHLAAADLTVSDFHYFGYLINYARHL